MFFNNYETLRLLQQLRNYSFFQQWRNFSLNIYKTFFSTFTKLFVFQHLRNSSFFQHLRNSSFFQHLRNFSFFQHLRNSPFLQQLWNSPFRINPHCPKSNQNFRDITWSIVENIILHEIFHLVSRFPRATFHVNRGKLIFFGTVFTVRKAINISAI